ncbi:BTB/POZ domain-containing protein At4g30940-like [Solanum dulcamara]|uniref:BTB/POZ domain-containing protein At4g30940-like n=1 Tax=Solanum dulcamara TaxID=45834 RepID=UPI0024859570|nr:BTB/POZ domain-containing protein At4g30940-like [Solanum dulcamara]
MESHKNRVKLNVGGKKFETTATTLLGAGRNSFFGAMFDENWNLHSDGPITEHFIDRNPDYFGVLLDLLRTGELYIPQNIDKKILYREAAYYGILDNVRSAECDTFDGNRLRLVKSITVFPSGGGKVTPAIRASLDGWCCVAQGSMVHVYDWMLEEHPTISLDYHKVNDVCWVNSESIVVSFDEDLANGGMGLFSASNGELKYKFQVTDYMKGLGPSNYINSAIDFSSDYKLFSSWESTTSYGHRIGVWDIVTGKLMDFLCCPPDCSRKNATRLQWLHDTNCVMAVYSHPKNDICLFDIRQRNMVWTLDRDRKKQYLADIEDAIAIEESSSICVVDWNECLSFMDLRSTDRSVNWRKSTKGVAPSHFRVNIKTCYPKLAYHKGQLFSSMEDRISVYCGSNWIVTSEFRQSHGGSICDFSIGGDRLFALRKEENVIHLWETPRPPII